MNLKMNFNFILGTLLLIALARPAVARPGESLDELGKEVAELRAELVKLQSSGASADRVAELERRIDLVAAEVEKARTSGAVEVEPGEGVHGFGPAASKVYRRDRGISIGGYGEALYQGGDEDTLDALRSVFYVGHKFSDRILFNSELEFEHATTGEGAEERGEVSVEFAYLDFKPWKSAGIRAGLVLVPMGFLNELHEPPIFHGARRTQTERLIIPTTWREVGAGAFGDVGPVAFRSYVVAGLDSAGFEGEQGIREGRQGGAESSAKDMAVTGRLDYTGLAGLTLGASLFFGRSGQGAEIDGVSIEGVVTVFDVHAQYDLRGLQLRGLFARSSIADAALINARNGLSGDEGVGERQYGFYLQAAYDVLNHRHGSWALSPFVRYEKLDTQDRVPAGFERDPKSERRILTVGVGVKPIPNVVLKGDYEWTKNRADESNDQLNLAIGYLF